MLGLISTIIAIVKKHYTFAAVVGIWTAVAWALYLTGAFEYVYAPGIVFLYIAIFYLKSPEAEAKKRAENMLKSKEKKRIFYCKKCGRMVEGFYTQSRVTCPSCNVGMMKTDFPCSLWDQMTDSEKENQRSLWDSGVQKQNPQLINELRRRRDQGGDSLNCVGSSAQSDENGRASTQASLPDTTPVNTTDLDSSSQISVHVQKFCRKCGKRLRPGAKFCNECGTQIVAIDNSLSREAKASALFICPSCGFVMESKKKYCPECGVLLAKSDVSADVNVGRRTIFCSQCGQTISADSKYCCNCGSRVSSLGSGNSSNKRKADEFIGGGRQSPVKNDSLEFDLNESASMEEEADEWKCPKCGKVNRFYILRCSCGTAKNELPHG